MRILAVDQSFTKTGIVIFEDGKIIYFEIYKTIKEDDIFQRCWDILNRITELTKQYQIEHVVIEGLAFAKTGNATRDLAGLQFSIIIKLRFIDHTMVTIIPPTTVKKIATGKGNSKKTLLLEMLPKEIYDLFYNAGWRKTTGLLDLVDAYWIGISYLQKNKSLT